MYEARLEEMGITLPAAPAPVGSYVPAVIAGDFVYTAGQVPIADGAIAYAGKVGADLDTTEGYQAARLCALNCLAGIRGVLGSLDAVERVVKVNGYVNSAPGFSEQPAVVNGASDLLTEIFGEAGRHARAAVGVSELPKNAAVEVEMIVRIKQLAAG